MDAATVQTLLDDLLDSAVAELTSPPTRRIIAHGAFAHDCEQVVSSLRDWSLVPQDQNAPCSVLNVLTLTATVVRCYPAATGDEPIPDASDITAAANVLAADAANLTEGLSTRWQAGTLFPNVTGIDECSQVGWVGARPLGPEGGMAGWEITLSVTT